MAGVAVGCGLAAGPLGAVARKSPVSRRLWLELF